MNTCQNHPTELKEFPDLRELAYKLENLRYDRLAEFLLHLSEALSNRALRDQEQSRVRLADRLSPAAHSLLEAGLHIRAAWRICKPRMLPATESRIEEVGGE